MERMMSRRELREHIFKLLFFVEFHPGEELPEQLKLYFDSLGELDEKDYTYIREKFRQIKEKLPQINAELDAVAKGWKTKRMGKVDLTILRLAAYEIRFDEDIPTSVAINEAVELGKSFGGEDSSAFINGILARMV